MLGLLSDEASIVPWHIQHHAASLSTRIRLNSGIQVAWVGKGARASKS